MTNYTQITIQIPSQWEEAFTMALFEAGAEGVEVQDPALIQAHLDAGDWDASIFDGQALDTSRLVLRCLFATEDQGQAAADALRSLAQEAQIAYDLQLAEVPEVDWQQKWKEGFTPQPVGERLWLTPVWDQTPAPADRIPVRINPGQAFGTGDHATTRMALRFLEDQLRPGETILDLGCGSGLLAIAGLKLGAARAIAVDLDPVCQAAVAEHRQENDIRPEQLTFYCGDVLSDEKLQRNLRRENRADVVVANITASVIFDLARIVGRFMAHGARFICSGVLDAYAGQIGDRLVNCGLAVIGEQHEDGWTSFLCVAAYE